MSGGEIVRRHAARLGMDSMAADLLATAIDARNSVLREHVSFLLDRLVDHEVRMTSEDDAREWHGHVVPAMARLRIVLAETS